MLCLLAGGESEGWLSARAAKSRWTTAPTASSKQVSCCKEIKELILEILLLFYFVSVFVYISLNEKIDTTHIFLVSLA